MGPNPRIQIRNRECLTTQKPNVEVLIGRNGTIKSKSKSKTRNTDQDKLHCKKANLCVAESGRVGESRGISISSVELRGLYEAIAAGDAGRARAVTVNALAQGTEPLRLVDECMVPAMEEAGRKFECNEYFVPDLLLRARAMKTVMALVRPLLAGAEVKSRGRIILGTVKGDVHDIGKNLVRALLEGAGFEVIDLGVGVSQEKFIAAVAETNAQIVGLSALLTSTMYSMKTTIEAMQKAGVRNKVKVLVGGAPITREFAEEIGADGTSNSGTGAVALAKLVLGLPAAPSPGVHLCIR